LQRRPSRAVLAHVVRCLAGFRAADRTGHRGCSFSGWCCCSRGCSALRGRWAMRGPRDGTRPPTRPPTPIYPQPCRS
jgi:hypothetical protein